VRIISGSLRGRKLVSVRGLATRPTSDRTREAIFNILGQAVAGQAVLDLFAGTGALALEALSRGASSALLVDNARAALETIRKNVDACGLSSAVTVRRWDLRRPLSGLFKQRQRFNLVFMDPPYGQGLTERTLMHLHDSGALADQALVVIEHHVEDDLAAPDASFQLEDRRRYGKTLVTFMRYML
jgi:16S rRNA (guanine966-N2)-methyltransferase